jgi:hypothetical protein
VINPDDLILDIKQLGMSNKRRELEGRVASYQDSIARAQAADSLRRLADRAKDRIDPAATVDPNGPRPLWIIAGYSAAVAFSLAVWALFIWLCLG